MIVKILGYDNIAKLDDIYKVSFRDAYQISKSKKGFVDICTELEIMKVQDRRFRPKDKVTNIEIAMAISYMSKYLD